MASTSTATSIAPPFEQVQTAPTGSFEVAGAGTTNTQQALRPAGVNADLLMGASDALELANAEADLECVC